MQMQVPSFLVDRELAPWVQSIARDIGAATTKKKAASKYGSVPEFPDFGDPDPDFATPAPNKQRIDDKPDSPLSACKDQHRMFSSIFGGCIPSANDEEFIVEPPKAKAFHTKHYTDQDPYNPPYRDTPIHVPVISLGTDWSDIEDEQA